MAVRERARVVEVAPDTCRCRNHRKGYLTGPSALSGRAFILNQLKHPDEVVWLRRIYGSAFHLIGVYCPEEARSQYLNIHRNMTKDETHLLIERDRGEEIKHGQQVTETFQHADLFVELPGFDEEDMAIVKAELHRYLRLLFGYKTITPTQDEYGMYLAQAAAYRTADLSRQVGAAILTPKGEVVSLGTNEVPAPHGGQYWASPDAKRDFELGRDENAHIKYENLEEVLAILISDWSDKSAAERTELLAEMSQKLEQTRLMNLTEFGRAVHAEMDALLAAGRVGVSVHDCELYCTTFPCHNCAKHIVNAGILRVLFIEPYPKSLAERLHGDAIVIGHPESDDKRVIFQAFCGVAPRMYPTLFSSMDPIGTRIKRKDAHGKIDMSPAGLRTKASPLSYLQREATVAWYVSQLASRYATLRQEEDDETIAQ